MTRRSFLQLCTGFLSVTSPKIGAVASKLHSIQYQGNTITIEVTSGDPNLGQEYKFILPKESVVKLEKAIRTLVFGPRFANYAQLDSEFWNLRFPGYGSFEANQIRGKIDRRLDVMYIEIPETKLNRYFVVELNEDESLSVVQSFVVLRDPEITRVHRASGGGFQYSSFTGKVIIPKRR